MRRVALLNHSRQHRFRDRSCYGPGRKPPVLRSGLRGLRSAAWGGLALSTVLLFPACKEEAKPVPFVPNTGQIQILNGCGKPGAAEQFRNYLTERGFDIIEFGNAGSWNYAHTLVIARTANEPVARDLAKVLETDNLIHLSDPLALVDATVIIGKDYEELSKRWQRARP